jgi:hypothetical protein
MTAIVLSALLVSACTAGSQRVHPRYQTYRQSMGVMLVSLPEIRIFQQMPDGGRLFQDIQSREARRQAQAAIIRQLGERGYTARAVDEQTGQRSDYHRLISLFRSVNHAIQLHTYGPQIFPAKLDAFDYHVGSVAEMLRQNGADGLVLAIGYQSGSEKPAGNWFSIAVVEPEGRIIWYGLQGSPRRFDLRREEGVSALVARTMAAFREHGS